MSTDTELLEMAAKAHGNLLYIDDMDSWIHVDSDGNRGSWWNPLTDDGDALRLAVKLNLDILQDPASSKSNAVEVVANLVEGVEVQPWAREPRAPCPYAATRRAIVRAAAEIGKAMP